MNPYEILGVTPNANEDQIKKAYRTKAFELHPDRNPGDTVAADKFKQVQEAYDKLTSKKQNSWPGPDFDMPDIFADLFSFRGFSQNTKTSTRGRDIHSECVIDFEESYFGCEKEIDMRRGEQCETCKGVGAEPSGIQTCLTCAGQGVIMYKSGNMSVRTTCQECHGVGKKIKTPCDNCSGDGIIKDTIKVKINIPEGVKNGDKIKLSGQGEQKAQPGDAYITMKVKPHPLFERQDEHLTFVMPITFTQAVFGDEVEAPTLEGMKKIIIPPESKSGDVIRIQSKGFKNIHTRRRGDCFVVLEIDTSKPNDEKTEELIRKFDYVGNKREEYLRKVNGTNSSV
jgi:molecular chaperone DnaJ